MVSTVSVLLLLAPGFETEEAMVPFNWLRYANANVTLAAVNSTGVVTDTSNVTYQINTQISQVSMNNYSAVIVPGGQPGTDNLCGDHDTIDLIKRHNLNGSWICSIGSATGLVLAQAAGIMNGRRGCGYPGTDGNITKYGGTKLTTSTVVDGNIISARGSGVAQQFSYEIIKALYNEDMAINVSKLVQQTSDDYPKPIWKTLAIIFIAVSSALLVATIGLMVAYVRKHSRRGIDRIN
jgi:4-methyl-5(b-hydroxyethyl)-thiazole monophosphate biosynthesis